MLLRYERFIRGFTSTKGWRRQLCETISYTKPLSEMEYLKQSGIRGVLDFTTQHIARPTNDNDREIYKIAVDMWFDGKRRLNYAELPSRLQKHKNKETFLNRFSVVDPDGCCHTVVAHIAMDGHYYIYPTPNPTLENVRSITVQRSRPDYNHSLMITFSKVVAPLP